MNLHIPKRLLADLSGRLMFDAARLLNTAQIPLYRVLTRGIIRRLKRAKKGKK